uniref:Uncharacterized protein n=1 Tax=Arundo donax TaxID=35708 RepID=A0A0A9TN77_ARUDO
MNGLVRTFSPVIRFNGCCVPMFSLALSLFSPLEEALFLLPMAGALGFPFAVSS